MERCEDPFLGSVTRRLRLVAGPTFPVPSLVGAAYVLYSLAAIMAVRWLFHV